MARGRGIGRYLPAEVILLSIAINACMAATDIYGSPIVSFQLRDVVLVPFVNGHLRTFASDWMKWSPGAGFILWETLALPALFWLTLAARRIGRLDAEMTKA